MKLVDELPWTIQLNLLSVCWANVYALLAVDWAELAVDWAELAVDWALLAVVLALFAVLATESKLFPEYVVIEFALISKSLPSQEMWLLFVVPTKKLPSALKW